jgi:hypothetical protein
MDRFRVVALEKLLVSNTLEGERLALVRETLVKKCKVLVRGFARRDKVEDQRHYLSLIKKYG